MQRLGILFSLIALLSAAQTPRLVYPVTDAGKTGTLTLTASQSAWVQTVVKNAYWKKRIHHLWFAMNDERPNAAPYVFYVESGNLRQGTPDVGTSFQIVGQGCDEGFLRDPADFEVTVYSNIYLCYQDPLAPQSEVQPSPIPAPTDGP